MAGECQAPDSKRCSPVGETAFISKCTLVKDVRNSGRELSVRKTQVLVLVGGESETVIG